MSLCNNIGKKETVYLTKKRFIHSALTLKFGAFEEVARIIFNLFDFDMDGRINTQDIKLLISYLPLKINKHKQDYYYQMESLKELDEIIAETFKIVAEITFEEFLSYISNNANVFLIVFCYLYLAIPAMDKNIELYKNKYDTFKLTDKLKGKNLLASSSSSSSSSSDKDNPESPSSLDLKTLYNSKQLFISPTLFSPFEDLKKKNRKNRRIPKEDKEKKIQLLSRFVVNNNKNITLNNNNNITNNITKNITNNINNNIIINNNIDTIFEKEIILNPETPITKSLRTQGVMLIPAITNDEKEKHRKSSKDNINNKIENQTVSPNNFLKQERYNARELMYAIKKSTILECNKETSTEDIFIPNTNMKRVIIKVNKKEIPNEKLNESLKKNQEIPTETPKDTPSEKQENLNPTTESTELAKKIEEKNEAINLFVKHEGELFKFNKVNGKVNITYLYMALIDQSIYYYNNTNNAKDDYYNTQFLAGCFIKENDKEEIGSNSFYSFSIICPEDTKRYYHKDYEEINTWIKHLREALGHKNFFEYYKLGETIGKGQFGVIKLGFDFKTKEKVAIKILNKNSINKIEDLKLIRTEIDIMKHSKHPNIVRFINHFENSDYIFIVMELLKDGSLEKLLTKSEFKITEKRAASICYQIADALLYLHKYGVMHRDLKPENILIIHNKDIKNEYPIQIKLLDFGLSKILGNSEMANEGYGTLAYLSPEVILKHPYNDKVDIWSLGILIYFILSGELPFMPKNHRRDDMAKLIVKQSLTFSEKLSKYSEDALNLIASCLEKKAENRINIEEVVKHPWFQNNLKL